MPPKTKSKHRPLFSTRNPSNHFLVQHLILARNKGSQGRFGPRDRKDHKFFMYSTAMDSIRKYPLPIVCEEQLKMLIGIGDYLSSDLLGVIRHHYRKFLLHRQDPQSVENNSDEGRQFKQSQSQFSNHNCVSEGERYNGSDEEEEEKRDHIRSFIKSKPKSELQVDPEDSNSSRSIIYKPRAGSQAANVLRILRAAVAGTKSMTKNDIDSSLISQGFDKTKNWKNCKDQLLKSDCITLDHSFDYQAFFITDKGKLLAEETIGKQVSNVSKIKMQEEIKQFKQKFKEDEIEKTIVEASQSQSGGLSSARKGGFCYGEDSNISMAKGLTKEKLRVEQNCKLILIVDTREMKDHNEKGFFQEKLTEKYQIETQTYALTIGDFAFLYNGKVLDFIIERKKADDLSASIIDGRYKDQKYRLKHCGAANVIYLYEGHPSASCTLKEKQLNNALTKTRIADGFIVYKTKTINETAKLLAYIHSELSRKMMQEEQEMVTIGTIEEFNKRNSKSRLLTIEQVFGLGLKSFPNVGKQTVSNLIRFFKSYRLLYDKLEQLENDEERIQFLNGLLKGGRTQAGVTRLIVMILFKEK